MIMDGVNPIGIFDSGVGGLTVAVEIQKILPYESIIYLGDLLHLPYGSKSSRAVLEFSKAAVEFLVMKNIKLLVIACNTATSVALDVISREVNVPVIGVIKPGVVYACRVSKNRRIGVIGTTRTIESMSYEKTIHSIDPDAFVFQKPTPLLVPLIEEGWLGHRVVNIVLEEYLRDFKDKGIDTLVLGCTHYPLLMKEISEILPGIKVVDSASTTAKMTKEILDKEIIMKKKYSEELDEKLNKELNNLEKIKNYTVNQKKSSISIYLTDYSKNFEMLARLIIGNNFCVPEIVSLNYNKGKLEYNS